MTDTIHPEHLDAYAKGIKRGVHECARIAEDAWDEAHGERGVWKTAAVGDVVRLKSGGPRMTIESVGEGTAVVVWFTAGECRRAKIALALLT